MERGLGALWPMLFAAAAAGGAALGAEQLVRSAFAPGVLLGEVLGLAAAALVGGAVYFALAAWLGIPEWRELRSRLAARRARSKS